MMQQATEAVRRFFKAHRLMFGLGAAVIVALGMTTIGMAIYNNSDVSRLDISRPGYESLRNSVVTGEESTIFDSVGTLNKEDVAAFKKLFDKKREALNALGKFDSDALNDDQLNIVPAE